VFEITGIHAASLRYSEHDVLKLERELGARCAVPAEVVNANQNRRAEWFAARVLLTRLIDHLNLSVFLQMNSAFGYPELYFLSDQSPASFVVSWSHTGDTLVLLGSTASVGVDIERFDRNVDKVLDRVCAPGEWERFAASPPRVNGRAVSPGVALWCAKEAVAKACGLGMRWGLKNFELLPRDGELWPVRIHKPGPRVLQDPAVRFESREGCLMALCSERAQLLQPLSWS